MKRRLPLLFLSIFLLFGYLHWRTIRYDSLIRRYCAQYNLDFHLVKSIIFEESTFNPSARGQAGELGLMQIMPYVGEEFSRVRGYTAYNPVQLLDPEHNIEVGCWYLRTSFDRYTRYSDPLPYALARYNAGESRVNRWMRASVSEPPHSFLDEIDFPQTRSYVLRVIERSRQRSHFYLW
ncbi:MAG: lytic transglycosylase domain-containing protein [Acidobacteria bacterium]|nr:lytic transglycosylase domain-containing protein [Acidobacteriota bacterium]